MTKQITDIQTQKRNKDRVNIYLDDQYAFSLDVRAAARLRVGLSLSEEDIAQLRQTDEVAYAYERAVRYLGTRPRSIEEIRRYLRRKDIPADVIEAVIERLETMRYVDDHEFARMWVRNRGEFNPRGAAALRSELRAKGIDTSIIDQVLEDLDTTTLAMQAAQRKLRSLRHEDETSFRRKLGNYLTRRGFDYETVRTVTDTLIEQMEFDTDDNVEE